MRDTLEMEFHHLVNAHILVHSVQTVHCTVQYTLVVSVLNLYIPYVQKTKLFFHANL